MSANLQLGPFRLLEPLAKGGMGEVWKGVHVDQDVPVAVKVITGEAARDDQYRADFRNEVRAMAGLDHPGVVYVFDYGDLPPDVERATEGRLVAGSPYLVMEFAAGGTLNDVKGKLSWQELRATVLALLDALSHAHAHGLVHRDLKPANVLLCGPEELRPGLKLTDFGIAHGVDATDTQNVERMMGTRHYMAPEQVLVWWRDYGPWTDLYALGCVVYALAGGRAPFAHYKGADVVRAQVEQPHPRLLPTCMVPPGFQEWLDRLLAKWPHERFQSAADAARALRVLGHPDGSEHDRLDPRFGGGWFGREEAARAAMDPPAGPIPPWRRPVSRRSELRLQGAGLQLFSLRTLPMTGRHRERDELWGALGGAVQARRARAVVVRGGPGTGKSRLVEWIVERAHEVGAADVLRLPATVSAESGEAVRAGVEALLQTQNLTGQELKERIDGWVGARAGDSALAQGLVRLVRPGKEGQLPPWQRHELVSRLVSLLARRRPVVVWLEDAQWDADLLELGATLLEDADEVGPVLVAATVRADALADDERAAALLRDLQRSRDAVDLELGPLAGDDRTRLVRGLLGLEEDLAARVEQRTGGNPMFAVQLIGDWVERGLLEFDRRGFRLRPGAEAALPDTMHGVWSARIDELLKGFGDDGRTFLERAAVLGQEVDDLEWHGACDVDRRGLRMRKRGAPIAFDREGLRLRTRLVDRMLARRMAVETEEGWRFAQTLLRESLERMAHDSGRLVAHHFCCAMMLESRIEEDEGESGLQERLGRHLLAAGEPHGALDALWAGACERHAAGAMRPALSLLGACEEAMRAAGRSEMDPLWGQMAALRARVTWQLGDRDDSRFWADMTLTLARATGDAELERETLRLATGWAVDDRDAEAAAKHLDAWKEALRLSADDAPWGPWFEQAGEVAWMQGDLDGALIRYGKARALYKRTSDARNAARILLPMARIEFEDGDVDAALDRLEVAEPMLERLGDSVGIARARALKSLLARALGDLELAEALGTEARRVWVKSGSREALIGSVVLGLAQIGRQKMGEARHLLEDAWHEARRARWKRLEAEAGVALLPCVAALKDWPAWDELWPGLRDAVGADRFLAHDTVWPLELAGLLCTEAGQADRARESLSLALARAQAIGDDQRAEEIETLLGG